MRTKFPGGLLLVMLLASAGLAPGAELSIQTIESGPLEASEILPLDKLPGEWEEAYWLVGDEKEIEGNLRLLVRERNNATWKLKLVAATVSPPGMKTDDTEALGRYQGYVYAFGSHFGKKQGPLELDRQFVARFREPEFEGATAPNVTIEIGRISFELHRVINDALRSRAVPVIGLREKTAELMAKPIKKLSTEDQSRIRPGDAPLNFEAVAILESGEVLIGLRFPVSAEGHPILLRVTGIESLFGPAATPLEVTGAWVLESAGSSGQLMGFRGMAVDNGWIDAIVGSIERETDGDGDPSALAEDYPAGNHAVALHVGIALNDLKAGPVLLAETIRRFEGKAIESIAVTPRGARYVVDGAEDVEVLSTTE